MSNISLSGLSAAQLDLNTTSNNIANANSFGFKKSRAEFADAYSNSLFTKTKHLPGAGVNTNNISQQFHEGSSIYTNNPIDLRISGNGFFAVAHERLSPQENELTRNGAFHLNHENYVVNSNNEFLLGYDLNPSSGEVTSIEPRAIRISDKYGQPKETSEVELAVNLSAKANPRNVANFDFHDADSYNYSTSMTVHDSLGEQRTVSSYFIKEPSESNRWQVYYTMTDVDGIKPLNIENGDSIGPNGHVGHSIQFNHDGTLNEVNAGLDVISVELGSGGNPINLEGADSEQKIEFNLGSFTQYAAPFEISKLSSDGASLGRLTKIEVNRDGFVQGTYSNGETVHLSQVALVDVANHQGLTKKGGTQWDSTSKSGEKIWGSANNGSLGAIQSGTLEQSNIDMTQELVSLISAQRNFQANSRALEVSNQNQQNILNLK